MTTLLTAAISAILGSVGAYFTWKSSPFNQRRQAEADLKKEREEQAEKKDEIRSAVHSNDDEKVNEIASRLLAPIMLIALCAGVGCAASRQATVYVSADRRIETVTNSYGVTCKAVPNAVFSELLEKAQELADLKAELKVDKRVAK